MLATSLDIVHINALNDHVIRATDTLQTVNVIHASSMQAEDKMQLCMAIGAGYFTSASDIAAVEGISDIIRAIFKYILDLIKKIADYLSSVFKYIFNKDKKITRFLQVYDLYQMFSFQLRAILHIRSDPLHRRIVP